MLKRLSITVFAASAAALAAVGETPQTTEQPGRPEQPAPAVQPVMPPAMFQPVAIDPELVRQSMQARAELDRLNRAVNARKTKLFEENQELQALQEEMRSLQEQIDAILEGDAKLNELKAQQREIAPELPIGGRAFPMAPQKPSPVKPPENQ